MITEEESGTITSTGLPSFSLRKVESVFRSCIIWSGFLSGLSAITTFWSESSGAAAEALVQTRRAEDATGSQQQEVFHDGRPNITR